MNCKFLKEFSKKEPALARLIELSAISGIVYILGALVAGELVSIQALLQASAVPLWAYFNKVQRDLQNK